MSTSQESVVSIRSSSTNPVQPVNSPQYGDEKSEFFEDLLQPSVLPTFDSISVPNTPPVPNFDLTSPKLNSEPINPSAIFNQLIPKLNTLSESQATEYPPLSLPVITTTDETEDENGEPVDPQKSVAELIVTFGGRGANANNATAKKIDFKNVFDPIFEVDGSEEQLISFSDGSDNNSSSGVSSEASLTLASTTSFQGESIILNHDPPKRGTRAYQQMKQGHRRNSNPKYGVGEIPFSYPSRRGSSMIRNSVPPTADNNSNNVANNNSNGTGNLKSILKTNKHTYNNSSYDSSKRGSVGANNNSSKINLPNQKPNAGSRRLSGNSICNKSTISSAAKVVTPKNMSAEDKNKKFQETKLENLDIVIPKTIRRPRLSCKADSRPASFIFVNLDTTSSSNKKKNKSTKSNSGAKNTQNKKDGNDDKNRKLKSSSESISKSLEKVYSSKEKDMNKKNEEDPEDVNKDISIPEPIEETKTLATKDGSAKSRTPFISTCDRLYRNEKTKSFNENHKKFGSNTYHGRRSFEKDQLKMKDTINGRPPWNIVCTGSVGRAKQRLVITGFKNPRRSSIPDF